GVRGPESGAHQPDEPGETAVEEGLGSRQVAGLERADPSRQRPRRRGTVHGPTPGEVRTEQFPDTPLHLYSQTGGRRAMPPVISRDPSGSAGQESARAVGSTPLGTRPGVVGEGPGGESPGISVTPLRIGGSGVGDPGSETTSGAGHRRESLAAPEGNDPRET